MTTLRLASISYFSSFPLFLSNLSTRQVPDYVLSSQNSVVAKVAWSYTLKENGQEYDDGLLVIVLKTDPITNLVTEVSIFFHFSM